LGFAMRVSAGFLLTSANVAPYGRPVVLITYVVVGYFI
jgi:hypothetical protein